MNDPQPQSPEQIAPTPRTDAVEKNFGEMPGEMRNLERELTAANAATSAMREERDNAISEVRSVIEHMPQDVVVQMPGDGLFATLAVSVAKLTADRDAWQRRAQESEARVKRCMDVNDEVLAKLQEARNERDGLRKDLIEIAEGCGVGVPDQAEAKRRIIALSAAAKKHEAEVAELRRDKATLERSFIAARDLVHSLHSLSNSEDEENTRFWKIKVGEDLDKWDAIHAARNTASEPQQP